MNKTNISAICPDDIDGAVKELNRVTSQIRYVQKQLSKTMVSDNVLHVFCDNVAAVLGWWCGNTYLGQRKDCKLSMAFQRFFLTFYDFLIYCKNSSDEGLNDFARRGLYQGTVYRYLGYDAGNRVKYTEYVNPDYNEVYVSWSKNLNFTPYMKEKLQKYVTKLECNISCDYYGIDLEGLDVSRPNEREVVFPTIESTVVSVKQLPV